MKQKGRSIKNWNWQLAEDRSAEIIEEENDYLTNVEAISHPNSKFFRKTDKSGEAHKEGS